MNVDRVVPKMGKILNPFKLKFSKESKNNIDP
jgi:hypothetical protein